METKTLHGLVIPLLTKILENDKSVQSVVDIGCNFAYVDNYLAKKFENVQFSGVDVPKNIIEINSNLIRSNLKIYSGYALKMFKEGLLAGDVVYFSSTATAIKTLELKNYLQTLSSISKYVVFNEPLFPLTDGHVVNPDEVDLEESIPISIAKGPLNNDFGYLCRSHNYKGLMDVSGFEPIYYEVYKPDFTDIYWVRAIGQNRSENLW